MSFELFLKMLTDVKMKESLRDHGSSIGFFRLCLVLNSDVII